MTESKMDAAGPWYAAQRWSELNDVSAAWWTRSGEVGLRLRLDELDELAELNAMGAVRAEQLEARIKATVVALDNKIVTARFPGIKESLTALRKCSVAAFTPAGRGPGAVRDIAAVFREPATGCSDYVEARISAVADAAAAGWDIGDLRLLDEGITILDAELAYVGHSRGWRAAAASQLAIKLEAREEVAVAIHATLEDLKFNESRTFDIYVPVYSDEPLQDLPHLRVLPASEALLALREWAPGGREVAEQAVARAHQVLAMPESVTAVDSDAAVAILSEHLRRAVTRWRLMGHDITEMATALVHDPLARTVREASLPQDPLDVAPPNLRGYRPREGAHLIEDAIDQLAEAHSAAAPAALVDLWTVVEALYGGVLEDRPHLAGHVLAGVGEYCYVHDVLRWLSGAVERAGIGTGTPGDKVGWIIQLMGEMKGDLGKQLRDAHQAMTWARWKGLTRWNGSNLLVSDLDRLRAQLLEVVDRAYLIRNFAVHQARNRDRGLARVLPPFAGLVQAAVDHTLLHNPTDSEILSEAMHAQTQVRTVAADLAANRSQTPGAIASLLPGAAGVSSSNSSGRSSGSATARRTRIAPAGA